MVGEIEQPVGSSFSDIKQSRSMDLRNNKRIRQLCSPHQVSAFFSISLILIMSGVGICAADNTAYDWNNLGESYYSSGDYDDAITAFMNAVAVNPNYGEAWNNLGKAYEQVGRYQDAVLAYRRAVAINPRFTEAWNNLGNVYEILGRYEDARDAYQRATSTTSDFSVPPMNQHPPNGQPDQYPANQPAGPQMPGMNQGPQPGR
jgi:tetratricopeptide (TPR) repeat protein